MSNKFTTQQRGQIAQLKVEQRAIELGFLASKPTSDARYDLVLDDGKSLLRVQVKYADSKSSNSSGAITIDFRRKHKNRVLVYDKTEVDWVLAYIPAIDKIVRLKPEHFSGRSTVIMRFAPAANKQASGLNLVEDFLW